MERLLSRPFLTLAVVDLAYFTATGIAIYALPMQVTGPVGADEAGAGFAFGAYAFTALLLRPLAGRLCDVWGRRPLLLAAAALAGMVLTNSLLVIVGLRLLLGVAEAAFFVASFAMLADIAPCERFGEAMSYNSLGLYLGLALGPPLGEWLVGRGSFPAAWLAAAALAALAVLLSITLRDPPPAPETVTEAKALIHRRGLPATLGLLASIVAMGGFLSLAALRAGAVGLPSASAPLFLYGAIVVVGRLAFARVTDKLPALTMGAASLGVIGAGLVVVGLWSSPAALLAGTAVLALGVTFSTPAFASAVFSTAEPSERGVASATLSIAIDLGLGVGPILMGWLALGLGIGGALTTGAVVAFAGVVWTLHLRRTGHRARPDG